MSIIIVTAALGNHFTINIIIAQSENKN